MSKTVKPSHVKTNIAKPIKTELFRIMRDNPNQTDREIAVGKSEVIKQYNELIMALGKRKAGIPTSRDTFKRLEREIKEMPLSEVLLLPKDLQDWIIEIRPHLKQDLERKRVEDSLEPTMLASKPMVIPKRKIKSRIIEGRTIDGKTETFDRIELY